MQKGFKNKDDVIDVVNLPPEYKPTTRLWLPMQPVQSDLKDFDPTDIGNHKGFINSITCGVTCRRPVEEE
jgi:hypothetical protein